MVRIVEAYPASIDISVAGGMPVQAPATRAGAYTRARMELALFVIGSVAALAVDASRAEVEAAEHERRARPARYRSGRAALDARRGSG